MKLKANSKNKISKQTNNDLRIELRQDKNGITIINRNQGGAISCFFLLLVAGCCVATTSLCAQLIIEPTVATAFFAVPLLTLCAFAYFHFSWQWLGREEFVLSLDRAEIKRYCGFKFFHNTISTREITLFCQRESYSATEQNRTGRIAMDMETLGLPVRCLHNLTSYDANFVVNSLNEFLRKDCAPHWTNRVEPKTPGKAFTSMPTHSNRFRFDYGFSAVSFSRRGSFEWSKIPKLFCIGGFWNAMVCMFILSQLGWIEQTSRPSLFEWWMCNLILIPHTFIGLGMLAELTSALTRPLLLTEWLIDKPAITKRVSLLGLTVQRKSFDLQIKSRFRIRRMTKRSFSFAGNQHTRPNLREVVLLNSDKQEYCTISNLTEAEATAIASQLENYCRGWVTM